MSLIVKGLNSYPKGALRWAIGGWGFFIVENVILSENRQYLIDKLGDENYHKVYGTFSTIATISIGYAYYRIRKQVPTVPSNFKVGTPENIAAWLSTSIGLVLVSQVAPTFQIPVTTTANNANVGVDDKSNNKQWNFQVRCPFDFADKRMESSSDNDVRGMERISRHPTLWSFGFVALGQSLLTTNIPLKVWWLGPTFVALLGGNHTDSRFRRNIGGTLPPELDCQTSNIPFLAILSGKQVGGWEGLRNEIKPINAALAVTASSMMWILRRKR